MKQRNKQEQRTKGPATRATSPHDVAAGGADGYNENNTTISMITIYNNNNNNNIHNNVNNNITRCSSASADVPHASDLAFKLLILMIIIRHEKRMKLVTHKL